MINNAYSLLLFFAIFVSSNLIKPCLSKTVVIYHLISPDGYHLKNFEFFLREGIEKGGISALLLSSETRSSLQTKLPQLPQYVTHVEIPQVSSCRAYKYVLDKSLVTSGAYNFFFFMDSTVAGPFLPPHLEMMLSWREVFTSRLSSTVKLVGNAISCDPLVSKREAPHFYDNFFVTDATGLDILRSGQSPLSQRSSVSASQSCETLSLHLFEAGYTIDSLMTRYQDVDWMDKRYWTCNNQVDPFGSYRYDGTTVDPYEVVFVPLDMVSASSFNVDVMKAIKFMEWRSEKMSVAERVEGNAEMGQPSISSFTEMLYESARGKECLDQEFCNRTKLRMCVDEESWRNYVYMGQFENKLPESAFRCKLIYERQQGGQIKFRKISTKDIDAAPPTEDSS